jgi:Family of unknown function (DUF6183)
MANQIEDIVRTVGAAKDPSEVFATIDGWAEAGRASDLAELWRAIDDESVADHIEEAVALTAGDAFVDVAFALAKEEPDSARTRTLASRLGYGQPKEAFLAALEKYADQRELLACWMHEIVLRGTPLDGEPAAVAFHEKLEGHVLGTMPLTLLRSEREAPSYMPLYGERAIQSAVATLQSGAASTRTIPPPGERTPPTVTRTEDAALEARLAEAFGPWTESTKGKCEAKVFALAPPVNTLNVGRWLVRALPLSSIEDAQGIDIQRVEVDVVWGGLFAAAANGGASSSGLGGAYGRRAAWTSLGGLVDAAADASVEAVDDLASESAFLVFAASGPWFHDIAWDLGVAALRPGGQSVAVVAATDSDGS